MYYSNPDAISYWNGTATFVFFDDFSDASKWSLYTGSVIQNGVLDATLDVSDYSVENAVNIDDLGAVVGASVKVVSRVGSNAGFDIGINTNIAGDNDGQVSGNWYLVAVEANGYYRIWEHTGTTYTQIREISYSVPLGVFDMWTIKISSDGNIKFYLSNDLVDDFTDDSPITNDGGYLAWREGDVEIDYVFVGDYVDPEPSHSIGSEESCPVQDLIVTGCYFSTGQQITVKGYVYYEGTTTPPTESVTVYVECGGSVKASTSSLTDGLFTLSWTESSAGLRTYTIYAVSDGRVSVQNQTVQAFTFTTEDGTFRWGFSNDTIASFSWDDTRKRLNVTFSSPSSSKLYIYGRPTYILGETFDLGTDYSAGWTQLDLNQTTSVATAHPNWGDFYVRKLTDGEVTDAYWTDHVFTLVLNGTSGTSATLEIYCGSRGIPKAWSGFTGDPTYDAETTILSGPVTYQSPVTVTLDYTIPTSGGSSAAGGGGSSSSAGLSILPTISLSVVPVQLIQIHPGETVTGMLSINFTGVNNIRVFSLEFSGVAADWITLAEPLPKTIFKPIGSEVGTGEIEIRIIAPENAHLGDYTVPVVVKAEAVGSQIQTNGYVTFSIVPQTPQISLVPEYMTWIFAAALIAIVAYAYLKD